jgi:hypothetical protein
VLSGLIKFMGGLQKAFQPAIDAVKWLTTGIASLFEWLSDHLVGHSVIPDMVRSIVGWFAGLPGKAVAALGNIAVRLGNVMVNATNRMINAVSTGLRAVVSWLGDLPWRAANALGDLGSTLYKSGQALLRGFIDGIKSMGSAVGDAASAVLGFAKDNFPNSPAKKGPFSGSWWTYHSGVATARDMGCGCGVTTGHVAAAAAALMGSASGQLAGAGAMSLGGGGFAGAGDGGAGAGGHADGAHRRSRARNDRSNGLSARSSRQRRRRPESVQRRSGRG